MIGSHRPKRAGYRNNERYRARFRTGRERLAPKFPPAVLLVEEPLAFEEQEELTEAINNSSPAMLAGIIRIIRESATSTRTVADDEDEIDLEIHRLDTTTKRKLQRYVMEEAVVVTATTLKVPTRQLPCLASDVCGLAMDRPVGWSPSVRTMLAGSLDSESPMSILQGHSVLPNVFDFVSRGSEDVTLTIPASRVGVTVRNQIIRYNNGRDRDPERPRINPSYELIGRSENASELGERVVAFASCGTIKFPEPQNLNVNMMPFVIGDRNSLPPQLQPYYDNLVAYCPYDVSDEGNVGYITVQESVVEEGTSQRRGGLHIDSPGVFEDRAYDHKKGHDIFYPGREHHWGQGILFEPDRFKGGIYVASSVEGSTEVYDALVDKSKPGLVDRHGSCEHLRRFLGKGTKLVENELVWLTDETPHEALPLSERQYRQFFRFVGPYVSHWYSDHSTANPLCPVPGDVVVVHGDKFGIHVEGDRKRSANETAPESIGHKRACKLMSPP